VLEPGRGCTAPLDRVQPAVRRGDTVTRGRSGPDKARRTLLSRRDSGCLRYLARTEKPWTKRQGRFWSGEVEDNGKGPVEKGAHLYRSLKWTPTANPINKRNAWATRAVVYVRLIPRRGRHGHFRMKGPVGGRRPSATRSPWTAPFAIVNSFGGNTVLHLLVCQTNQPTSEFTPHYDDANFSSPGRFREFPQSSRKFPTADRSCRSQPGFGRRSARRSAGASAEDRTYEKEMAALERLRHWPAVTGRLKAAHAAF